MQRPTPIFYRDMWDVPRIFYFTDSGRTYLFEREFDETVGDFPDEYRVYLMPTLSPEDVAGPWADLPRKAQTELGRVPLSAVRFDPTCRRFVDALIVDAVFGGVELRPAGMK